MANGSSIPMPAISLAAVPGRRNAILDIAVEAEARGFAGIYLPSVGDNMSLATAIAVRTSRIEFGTAIAPIYFHRWTWGRLQPSYTRCRVDVFVSASAWRMHPPMRVTG